MFKIDFPIYKNNPNLVYLDSGATAQKPQAVIDAMNEYMVKFNSNVHRGIYKISEKATEEYERSRIIIQKFINAKNANEVIFTYSTTDSANLVAYSYLIDNLNEGDVVITTEMEHHSNFIPWQQISKTKKAKFEILKVNENFEIDMDYLEEKVNQLKPKFFAITHVSNVLGTINDIDSMVRIIRGVSPETKIFIDAAQSVSRIKIDVQKLDIDFLAFSGHKLYGPNGIGVLWAREEILNSMKPFRYGGGMIQEVKEEDSTWAEIPSKFEGGTPNVPGAIGLGKAIEFVGSVGLEKIYAHDQELRNHFLMKIKDIEQLRLYHPEGLNGAGIFSFSLGNVHPHDIAQILDEANICVRAGHHCTQVLHTNIIENESTTRVSFGMYNELEDIDKFIDGMQRVLEIFKLGEG